ncbi:MAG: O-antigen ligase family protein [Acidobacteria bacterium]|nr:O-antigen ligase family protein [Acidobacteriota bacterium]
MQRSLATSGKESRKRGTLFGRETSRTNSDVAPVAPEAGATEAGVEDKSRLAFAGIYLLTLLMFIRPHEVMPGLFGGLPLIKILAISTIVIYIFSRVASHQRIITWPIEMKMMTVMWVMGIILTPIAVSPRESIDILKDAFANALIVFILLINLINTRSRLRSMLFTMVCSGIIFSLGALKEFRSGGVGGEDRMKGWSTQFENPNDFAAVLTMILPLIIYFLFTKRGMMKLIYLGAAIITSFAILLTFSRSGFLGLIGASGVIAWNLTRGRRAIMVFASTAILMGLLLAMPGSYMTRLSTMFNPNTDKTGSAQERQELLKRAAQLAVKRSVVGVGMGNFHVYSIREKVAHNSYLETAAELGLIGLIAYLTIIIAPLLALRRVQHRSDENGSGPDREMHIMAVCLQASIVAYIVYGFFGSVQYFYVLYFFVGYAVALRQIYGARGSDGTDNRVASGINQSQKGRGALWLQRRYRKPQLA